MVRAKGLLAEQRALTDRFAQQVSALGVANQQTKDATTKSLTLTLLASAEVVERDLEAYSDLLEKLLSGSVPSTELVRTIGTSAVTLSKDLQTLGVTLNQLSAHFAAYQAAQ